MKQTFYTDGSPSRELEDNDYDNIQNNISIFNSNISRIRDKLTRIRALIITVALSKHNNLSEPLIDYVLPDLNSIEEDLQRL